MGKHGKGRRKAFRRYLKGDIRDTLNLGALASLTLVATGSAEIVNERTWISSLRCTHSFTHFTPGENDGPVLVGVAHSDYSAAEIEAWIENAGSWDEGDLVSQEIAKRKIRRIGVHEVPPNMGVNDTVVLNDGKPITTKLGWMLLQGQGIQWWAYNRGTSVLTTGSAIQQDGYANLWPR